MHGPRRQGPDVNGGSFLDTTFFDSWSVLARTLVIGVLAYAVLIVWLRVSGKRTLSKWNAFDFIITIALGSTLASMVTSRNVALAQGVVAFTVLIGLQFVITWASVRAGIVQRLVKASPTLLLLDGCIVEQALCRQRVTESELRAAARLHGHTSLASLHAVVLETNGKLSVIARREQRADAMQDVDGYDARTGRDADSGSTSGQSA